MKKAFLIVLSVLLLLTPAWAEEAGETAAEVAYDTVDIDLYRKSDTIIAAIITNIQNAPDSYLGKVVRMSGELDVTANPGTGEMYFTVQTADAAACCVYGFDFLWRGEHAYPEDYGQVGDVLTVTGILDTYQVGTAEYLVLRDAQVVWGLL